MVKKINRTAKAKPEAVDKALTLYPNGAPCHSSLFHGKGKIHSRPRQVEVKKCKVKCKGGKWMTTPVVSASTCANNTKNRLREMG